MKTSRILVTLLVTAFALQRAAAQVGYVNSAFQAGNNWFGNPLELDGVDMLSSVVHGAPIGTTVSLWSPTSGAFTPSATWDGSQWSADFSLPLGTGALLYTPTPFTNTFVGYVRGLDGGPLGGTLTLPPPFAGPDGFYLFSCKTPLVITADSYPSVFEAILGREPRDGEQVTTLNRLTQEYSTTTFINGTWDNGAPTLGLAEAALFNIGPVPEPSSLALIGLAFGALSLSRHHRFRPLQGRIRL